MTLYSKKAVFAASALVLGVAGFTTQAQAATHIQAISANQISPTTTQIRLNFGGKPVLPVVYQQAGSRQLVLDFNQVSASLPRNTSVNAGAVGDVVALSSGNLTRVMVNLLGTTTHSTRIEGNQLVLEITGSGAAAPARTAPNAGVAAQSMNVAVNPLMVPANAQKNYLLNESITGIHQAGNTVNISLANEAIPVDVQRQGNKIVVRTTGNIIPRHLLRRLSGSGLISSVDVVNQGKNGLITINVPGDFEYQAHQSGAQLVVNVKPAKMLTEPTLEEKVYKGNPLSMEFQDIPVRTVLDVLSGFTNQQNGQGFNIVAADNVQGNITLRLINVPWDQALDIILKSKNLGMRKNGNVILVAPAAELDKQEADALKAAKEIKELAPLRTEYIRLNYAKAAAILDLIQKAATNSRNNIDSNRETGLLSSRGSVMIDARTNTLIVKDTSESINNVRTMIEKIDIPVSQIMIEARIVTATDNFSKDLGVRWGLAHSSRQGNRILDAGGSMQTLWDLREGRSNAQTEINMPANMMVDLGSNSPTGRIAFGLLNIADSILDLELSAMQADNRGEVISSPKVMTADKQKAKILSGHKIAYNESALNGATTVNFIDAALVLEVTPNITPDGKIGLELLVSNGRPTREYGAIAVAEDSINTNVMLEDGQTIVLGGVFRNTTGMETRKVPFLGDLPYVGRLFKNNAQTNNKEELLIFITPKLINDGISRIN